jgi:hypothetical protein
MANAVMANAVMANAVEDVVGKAIKAEEDANKIEQLI